MMKRRFDAVVTDVEMPRTTGFEVLEFCRAVFPQVPVVLMSAAAQENRNAALERFAYAYVEKPFAGSDLLRLLRTACRTTMGEGMESEERRIGSCSLPS
jgi:DNA-binding response OmpR family regulator